MRSFMAKTAPVLALLLAGFTWPPRLAAQDYGGWRRDDDRGYGRRDDWRGFNNPVDRTMSDLSRAARGPWGRDRHFDDAMRNLARFQDRWRDGRFDKGRLDHAIESVQHLVNSGRLDARDRQVLSNDLWALRDFRAHR